MYIEGIEQYTIPVIVSITILYLYAMWIEYRDRNPQ